MQNENTRRYQAEYRRKNASKHNRFTPYEE